MLKWLKCWIYGHDWTQKGFNRITHTTWDDDEIIQCGQRDHFLFFCRRCTEIREHACEFHYYDLSEDCPVFTEVTEEEEDE